MAGTLWVPERNKKVRVERKYVFKDFFDLVLVEIRFFHDKVYDQYQGVSW
jgi:hypothetical protein